MATKAPGAASAVAQTAKANAQPLSDVVANLPSSTATSATPSTAPSTVGTPAGPPKTTAIYKVDSQLAQIYTYIHTPLLLSLFAVRFPALVADPTTTLLQSAPVVALLQAAYSGICLQPAISGPVKKGKKKKTIPARPGTPTKKPSGYNLAVIVPRLITALLYTLAATPLLLALTITLGAPLTTHLPSTTLISLHLALLLFFPLFYARPLSSRHWLEICSGTAPLDEVYGATMGAVVGAWLGAVPIPLDWDRAWQAWPVTIVTGGYIGWGVGREIGRVVGGGWRGSWEERGI